MITPVDELNEQFAKDAFVKTSVVSVYSTPSPVAATVATVPEKFPSIVPKVPEPVVQAGASLIVRTAVELLTASPVFNYILI